MQLRRLFVSHCGRSLLTSSRRHYCSSHQKTITSYLQQLQLSDTKYGDHIKKSPSQRWQQVQTSLQAIGDQELADPEVSQYLANHSIEALPVMWAALKELNELEASSAIKDERDGSEGGTTNTSLLLQETERITLRTITNVFHHILTVGEGNDGAFNLTTASGKLVLDVYDALNIPIRRLWLCSTTRPSIDSVRVIRTCLHFILHTLMVFHRHGALSTFLQELGGDAAVRSALHGPQQASHPADGKWMPPSPAAPCPLHEASVVELALGITTLTLSFQGSEMNALDRAIQTLPTLVACAQHHTKNAHVYVKVWECFAAVAETEGARGTRSSDAILALVGAWSQPSTVELHPLDPPAGMRQTTVMDVVLRATLAHARADVAHCNDSARDVRENEALSLVSKHALRTYMCHVLNMALRCLVPGSPEHTFLMDRLLLGNILRDALLPWLLNDITTEDVKAPRTDTVINLLAILSVDDPTIASDASFVMMQKLVTKMIRDLEDQSAVHTASLSVVHSILVVLWNIMNRTDTHDLFRIHGETWKQILCNMLIPALDRLARDSVENKKSSPSLLHETQQMCRQLVEKALRFRIWDNA